MKPSRLDELLFRYEEDALHPEEVEELAALLETDQAARRAFVGHHLGAAEIAHQLAHLGDRAPVPRTAARAGALGRLLAARGPLRWRSDLAAGRGALQGLGGGVARRGPLRARDGLVTSGGPTRWLIGLGGLALVVGVALLLGRFPRRTASWSEGAALSLVPSSLLLRLRGAPPDAHGMVGANRQAFNCSGDQRAVADSLVVGAVLGEEALIAESLRAVDATFAHQTEAGNFGDRPYCVAYWLHELGHAVLVVRESRVTPAVRAHVDGWIPAIGRAAEWLAAPSRVAALERDRDVASRLFCYAGAFAFSGRLAAKPALLALGERFAQAGLALQRPDGAFDNFGGPDTGFQGTALTRLARYQLQFPQARLERSFVRGMRWLLGRVRPDGTLDTTGNSKTGQCQAANHRCMAVSMHHVAWGFVYFGALFDRAGYDQAGRLLDIPELPETSDSLAVDLP